MRLLNDINQTLHVAYKWLSEKQLTEKQLIQRLQLVVADHPAKNDLVYKTMKSLKDENLLQDEWIAESIAHRYAHFSNAAILKKLLDKGLSESISNDAIAKLMPEDIRAKRLAEQKWEDLYFESTETKLNKIKRYLESRGYSERLLVQAVSVL